MRSGDNLSLVFKRAGFSDRDVYNVVNTAKDGKSLGEYSRARRSASRRMKQAH